MEIKEFKAVYKHDFPRFFLLIDALLAVVIQQLAVIIKATGANSILIPQNCSVIAKQTKVYSL